MVAQVLTHLTAMMSYDLCNRIQILCVGEGGVSWLGGQVGHRLFVENYQSNGHVLLYNQSHSCNLLPH